VNFTMVHKYLGAC